MIEYDPPAGHHIVACCQEAVRLADRRNDTVHFDFSGVDCLISPGTNADEIANAIITAMGKGKSNRVVLPVVPATPATPPTPPDTIPTIYGPVPRALFLAYPEAFERLFTEHPEVFAAVRGPG